MHSPPLARTALLAAALLACSFDATGLGDEVGGTPAPGVTSVATGDIGDSGDADSTGPVDDTGGSGEASGMSDPSDPPASCGDGALNAGEQCDGGPNNPGGLACTPECTTNICGDSYVGAGEACDPGPDPRNGLACTPGCTVNTCGDGYLGVGELCDDGPNNGAGQPCTAACTSAKCGDGMPGAGEACDDGNPNNNDACLNTCQQASCGDDFLHAGTENCDEGASNGMYGGPCNVTCSGPGPFCGDGNWDKVQEQCDGNAKPDGVTCNGACKATCESGHAECNGNIGDGCEDLKYTKSHCGACNKVCAGGFNYCFMGACAF